MFIGRLAQLTGCTPKAIRLYEQKGLINAPQRSGRYRVYNAHRVQRVRLIRQAQVAGFTLAQRAPLVAAKQALRGEKSIKSAPWDSVKAWHTMESITMQKPVIEISDQPNPDAERILGSGLAAFNEAYTGFNDRQPLTVLIKDGDTDQLLGGITGKTTLGMAFLDLFHLPDSLRGSGLGSQLLQAFENEARRRGCHNAVLYTLSFQAPGFYERHGWVKFGELPCKPEGSSRIFMSKQL